MTFTKTGNGAINGYDFAFLKAGKIIHQVLELILELGSALDHMYVVSSLRDEIF